MAHYSVFPAKNLSSLADHGGIILDVRTAMEHAEKRLVQAHIHVPLDELKPAAFMQTHNLDKDASIYILCRSGARAAQAAEKFYREGYHNIYVIAGGAIACEDCGVPVEGHAVTGAGERPALRSPISLERQVRIAAGLFAATGALLALLMDPLFAVIPLFIGGGLIFAGVTDRCGMALLLTKAPWNKVVSSH